MDNNTITDDTLCKDMRVCHNLCGVCGRARVRVIVRVLLCVRVRARALARRRKRACACETHRRFR